MADETMARLQLLAHQLTVARTDEQTSLARLSRYGTVIASPFGSRVILMGQTDESELTKREREEAFKKWSAERGALAAATAAFDDALKQLRAKVLADAEAKEEDGG